MVGRGELTDHAWATIEPLLPRKGRRGGQWQDHRRVINGIFMEAAHGSALARSAQALRRVANLLRSALSLATGGPWDRLLTHVQTKSNALGAVVWEVSIDSSTARAYQNASGARRRRSRADEKKGRLPVRRGTRAQPWRADDQVPSRL
jgi:transposase